MFAQLYTVNRMQNAPPPVRRSYEVEKKDDVTHLERVPTHTPPSDMEKGRELELAPTVSRGPVVHKKVGLPCLTTEHI
jgi:hypothetical protein